MLVDEHPAVKMAGNGRLVIPAKLRKQLGMEAGGMMVARVVDGELILRPVAKVLAEIQATAQKYLAGRGTTVDQFIAERREEAAREEAKWR
jgi:AbrB family looped-hinge helix DNA binding protein